MVGQTAMFLITAGEDNLHYAATPQSNPSFKRAARPAYFVGGRRRRQSSMRAVVGEACTEPIAEWPASGAAGVASRVRARPSRRRGDTRDAEGALVPQADADEREHRRWDGVCGDERRDLERVADALNEHLGEYCASKLNRPRLVIQAPRRRMRAHSSCRRHPWREKRAARRYPARGRHRGGARASAPALDRKLARPRLRGVELLSVAVTAADAQAGVIARR